MLKVVALADLLATFHGNMTRHRLELVFYSASCMIPNSERLDTKLLECFRITLLRPEAECSTDRTLTTIIVIDVDVV